MNTACCLNTLITHLPACLPGCQLHVRNGPFFWVTKSDLQLAYPNPQISPPTREELPWQLQHMLGVPEAELPAVMATHPWATYYSMVGSWNISWHKVAALHLRPGAAPRQLSQYRFVNVQTVFARHACIPQRQQPQYPACCNL
jgi:hypothetical protein